MSVTTVQLTKNPRSEHIVLLMSTDVIDKYARFCCFDEAQSEYKLSNFPFNIYVIDTETVGMGLSQPLGSVFSFPCHSSVHKDDL